MQSIDLFYYLTRIVGISPFAMEIKKRNRILNDLLLTFPTFLALTGYSISLGSIFWKSGNKSADISAAANWIQFVPNCIAYIMALVLAFQKRKLVQEIITSFLLCDVQIKEFLGVSLWKSNRKTMFFSLFASILSILFSGIVSGINFYLSVKTDEIWTLFYWIAFCLPKFGLLLVDFQFVGCILYIYERLDILKKGIKSQMLGINYQVASEKPSKFTHAVSSVKMVPSGNANSILEKIELLIDFLQEISEKINKYFGTQIMFNLISGFVCITIQMYYVINNAKNGFEVEGSDIFVTASLSLVALHALEYWSIFSSGNLIKNKWRQVLTTFHAIKIKVADENVKNKVGYIDYKQMLSLKFKS